MPFCRTRPALRRAAAGALSLAAASAAAQESPTPLGGRHDAAGAARTVLVLDSIDLTAISTLSELLQARVPGLLVQSGSGSVGAGARVTARGTRSVYGFGDPLLVIDGVRAVGTQRSFELDSAITISRLDDVVLEHVETVEVLRGPAAAARYGPGASNGAIVVTTRAARVGPTRMRTYAQAGVAARTADYPTFYVGVGRTPSGVESRYCALAAQARGSCVLTRIDSLDLFARVPERTAPAGRVGVSVEGGGTPLTWLVAADARGGAGVLRGNDARRFTLRANVDARPSATLRAQVRVGATRGQTALIPGDQWTFLRDELLGQSVLPLSALTPARQRVDRGDASMRLEWTPASWLRGILVGGISDVSRYESRAQTDSNFPRGSAFASVSTDERGTGHEWVATGTLGAELSYRVGPARATTEVGVERLGTRRSAERRVCVDAVFVTPVVTPDGSSCSSETFVARWGALAAWSPRVVQRIDLGGRVAIDAAARWNRGRERLFGSYSASDVSMSAAWDVVRADAGRVVRVRTAYGSSTLPLAASAADVLFGRLLPVVCITCESGTGEPIRPERTREFEGGVVVDAGTRVRLSLTAFTQRTSDVLAIAAAPPSIGGSPYAPAALDVRNRGAEAELTSTLADRAAVGLTTALRASLTGNRVMGVRPSSVGPLTGGTATQAIRVGRPLGAYLRSAYSAIDANGDGVIVQDEVRFADTASPVDVGPAMPTRAASLDARLRLGRRWALSGLAEYRGGHVALGASPALYASYDLANFDRSQPLERQAWATNSVARRAGLVDRADFARLRELAVSFATGARARPTSVTVAARNLVTLTTFSGPDPEAIAFAQSPFTTGGYFTQPLPTTVSVRLTKSW